MKRKPKHLPDEALEHAAHCLKTISHPDRLKLIRLLMERPRPVGELAEACAISPHVASEHLGRMRDRGLLTSRREGRLVIYEIGEKALAGIIRCIERTYDGGGLRGRK